jgi:hypothetical protein
VADKESQEKAAIQFHAWMADRAAEAGGGSMPVVKTWTGTFCDDGTLVPFEGDIGFAFIPPFRVSSAAAELDDGFVVRHLFYAAQINSYAVVETVWAEEPEPQAAFPIGKPAPEGTAPLRWVDDEHFDPEAEGAPMVVWDAEDVACPILARVYPEGAISPARWMSEEVAREKFPHLWEE